MTTGGVTLKKVRPKRTIWTSRFGQQYSGRVGVRLHHGKHHATIMVNQRRIHCGYYDSFDDACAARAAAEIKYGFGLMH
jgi:hypothetical protein